MDIELQSKLLRTLQEGEIERIGGTGPIKVDVRIIAASNRNLEEAVAQKTFREDLYYRLNVFPIVIPPLRERKEDLPALAGYFISRYAREINIKEKHVTAEALDILKGYNWKGNVRELENVIERTIILCDSDTITPEHLRLGLTAQNDSTFSGIPMDRSLDETAKAALRIAESQRIKKALTETKGNKSKAAQILSVSYKTLLTKIKEYKIEG